MRKQSIEREKRRDKERRIRNEKNNTGRDEK